MGVKLRLPLYSPISGVPQGKEEGFNAMDGMGMSAPSPLGVENLVAELGVALPHPLGITS